MAQGWTDVKELNVARLFSYRFIRHASELATGRRAMDARGVEFVVRHGAEALRAAHHRKGGHESFRAEAQRARTNANEARARGL